MNVFSFCCYRMLPEFFQNEKNFVIQSSKLNLLYFCLFLIFFFFYFFRRSHSHDRKRRRYFFFFLRFPKTLKRMKANKIYRELSQNNYFLYWLGCFLEKKHPKSECVRTVFYFLHFNSEEKRIRSRKIATLNANGVYCETPFCLKMWFFLSLSTVLKFQML